MPNCEGHSRRCGVIFNSCDNDHYVVYTSPPPTAEPLLKEKPFGEYVLQLLPITAPNSRTQSRPRGTPILIGAGRAQHDRRGKAGSERRKACFHSGGSGFHLPRRMLSGSPLIRLAIRSTPSPVWEKAFIVVCYARDLAVLPNYRPPPRLIPALNYAPVAR